MATKIGKDTGQFKGEGITTKDVRLVADGKSKGDAMRLGIRPQHLVIDPKGKLKGSVTLVERLGTETIVELVTETNTPFRFASPEAPEIAIGQTLCFSFDETKAHLF